MVYIDLVIILNFVIDLILLLSVNYILRRNAKLWRIILGSLVGEVSLIIMFIKISNILLLLLKLVISIVMIVLAFGYRDSKYLGKNITYFYLVSMLLGGGIEFLSNQFKYSNNGLVFRDNGIGYSYVIIFIIGIFLLYKYMINLKCLKNNYSNYYRCKLYLNKYYSVMVNAYLDTGNKLRDPYSNKSIILVDKDIIDVNKLNYPIYVPYNSLNNHGMLECYKASSIEIDGKYFDKFLVGISNNKIHIDGIDCIINNNVMEGLR